MKRVVFQQLSQRINSWAFAFVLAIPWAEATGIQQNSIPVQLNETGSPAEFEIATTEFYDARNRRSLSHTNAVAPTTVEGMVQLAQQLELETGKSLDLILYPTSAARTAFSRRILTRKVLVRLTLPGGGNRLDGIILNPVHSELGGWYTCEATNTGGALALAERLRGRPGVSSAEPQLARLLENKWVPNDPLFLRQWHLKNSGTSGAQAGIDLNLTNVWDRYRGNGIVLGIVDDGLQASHPDLAPAFRADTSFNFNDNTPDPSPDLALDNHGTAVAGLAGARGNNSIGITGVAPESTIAGLRLTADPATDEQNAQAALFKNDVIAVKNNSWGGVDGSGELIGVGPLLEAARESAATNGRSGRGVIAVFAAGNGRQKGDNANYDGFVNSLYTIAVGAVTDLGEPASYSEPGACVVVSAPSGTAEDFCSGGRQHLVTTDLVGSNGYNDGSFPCELADPNYTDEFNGTSGAAPLVTGVVGLMLQANPNLSYREVTEILMRTARRLNPGDPDWQVNSSGLAHHHQMGAGLVNAAGAVALAERWTPLAEMDRILLTNTFPSLIVPDNSPTGITESFTVTNENFRVERVAIRVTAAHPNFGDLAITLVSPSGTLSRLSEFHSSVGPGYSNWALTSVRHWGESAVGTWRITIADVAPKGTGHLDKLSLEIHGSHPQPTLEAQYRSGTCIINVKSPASGWRYLIEASTDLHQWTPVSTVQIDGAGTAIYGDSRPGFGARFYRARALSQ